MAKEIREIIAMQEAVAAGNEAQLAGLKRLRFDVDYAEAEGFLDPQLPQESHPASLNPSAEGDALPTKDQLKEQLFFRPKFTDVERERLVGDEAKIFTLSGTTITQQRKARGEKPSFWYITNAGDRLLALPSRMGQEVAIFTAPNRFFVNGTFGKDTDAQERLVRDAGNTLADRLGLKNPQGKPTIAGIITDEAAALSDLTFQYLADPGNKKGIWLFGPEYAEALGKSWIYGRTKNSTNGSGSSVANVGYANSGRGLSVDDWGRDYGGGSVGALFLVVPIENK